MQYSLRFSCLLQQNVQKWTCCCSKQLNRTFLFSNLMQTLIFWSQNVTNSSLSPRAPKLVKFSEALCKICHPKCLFGHTSPQCDLDLWPFDLEILSDLLCPKLHKSCTFGKISTSGLFCKTYIYLFIWLRACWSIWTEEQMDKKTKKC